MAFGIYKPGQGYWVRVLTATFAGILILSAAMWVWFQMERLADSLPKAAYVLTISPATGSAAAGQSVALMGEPAKEGEPRALLGTATVTASEPRSGGQNVTITNWALNAGVDISQVRSVAPATGSASTLEGPLFGQPQAVAKIEPLYIEGAGAGLFILAGAIATFWMVGVSPRVVEFLIATDGEMKKVNWSTRKDIMGSTWVVIMWCVIIAGGLFVVDLMFSKFFQLIGVLQQ